jgi:hypothetical protein
MKRFWSQRAAIAFCAAVSIVSWIAIAFLFSILTPDQASQLATEGKAKESLDVAPATGPTEKKSD